MSQYLCMLDSQANANQFWETTNYLILTILKDSVCLLYKYEKSAISRFTDTNYNDISIARGFLIIFTLGRICSFGENYNILYNKKYKKYPQSNCSSGMGEKVASFQPMFQSDKQVEVFMQLMKMQSSCLNYKTYFFHCEHG